MASLSFVTLRARLLEQVRATAGGLPSTYWVLWTGTLVSRLGTFVVPFLALYLTRERGFTVEQAGLVVSLYGAGVAISGPLGGTMADRLGRRTALVLGLWLGAAAMLFLGFCQEPLWIRVGAFMLGVLGDLYRPAVAASISDVVPPQDRDRAFGLLFWVVNVGFAIALPLGGLVAQSGFFILFVMDALTTFLYGLFVWLKVPETLTQRAPSRSLLPSTVPFRDIAFLNFWLPSLLVTIIFFQSLGALALDLGSRGMGTAAFGLVMAVNCALIVLVQPFSARVVSKWRRSAVLASAAVLMGLGFGLHTLSFNLPLAMAAVAVWTLGEILNATVSPSVVADLAPAELRGSYQGAFQMSWGLAFCVAPALGGWVLGRYGGLTLWGGCLLLGLLAGAWNLAAADSRRRHLEMLRARSASVSANRD
jgi:MFS family permease